VRRLCRVSHDRERAMTPAETLREKGSPDGYLNAAVCMRVWYVAVHRRLESKPRGSLRRGSDDGIASRAAPVWKCSLGTLG